MEDHTEHTGFCCETGINELLDSHNITANCFSVYTDDEIEVCTLTINGNELSFEDIQHMMNALNGDDFTINMEECECCDSKSLTIDIFRFKEENKSN